MTKAETELGRFGLKPSNVTKFQAPWQLSTCNRKLAEQRLKDIHVPTHLDFKLKFLFTHSTRLKSHDWKQVCKVNTGMKLICIPYLYCYIDCMHWHLQILFAGHVGQETKRYILLLFGHLDIACC